MKREDVVVGMKVVPHTYFYGCNNDIGFSHVWRTRDKTKNFLYVNSFQKINGDDIVILSNKELSYSTGDFFIAENFEPYIEKVICKKIRFENW